MGGSPITNTCHDCAGSLVHSLIERYPHAAVFSDQKTTLDRDGRLWYRDYSPARCITVSAGGAWGVDTSAQACSQFDVLPVGE